MENTNIRDLQFLLQARRIGAVLALLIGELSSKHQAMRENRKRRKGPSDAAHCN